MSGEDTLSKKEKFEIAVEAGLQLIPTIAGSLATAYFGTKNEKRFKRIKSFYEEFSKFAKEVDYKFASIHSHNPEELVAIIEDFNEKLEREHTEEKRSFFKQYFKNTLIHPVKNNFDERKFMLEILANITLTECELLVFLYKQPAPVVANTINKPGVDPSVMLGAIGRLKNYGFLNVGTHSITFGQNGGNISDTVQISTFGIKFVNFCLKD